MANPSEQKRRSRENIVSAASRLFRRRGYRDTSVDDLMAEAGLTRGAFYAHFHSKADLFAQALGAAFAQARENLLERGLEALQGEEWLDRAAERYVSPAHRDTPDEGCAIPSLGGEVARLDDGLRAVFAREVETILEGASARIGGDPKTARKRAIRHLATWVGGLLLARAVPNGALSDEILEASGERRPFAETEVAETEVAAPSSRAQSHDSNES